MVTMKERMAKYYLANREKILEQKKEYYRTNIERIKEKDRKYYQKNKIIHNEKNKVYHLNNIDKIKQRKKEYYQENKIIINKRRSIYDKQNREKINKAIYKKYYNNINFRMAQTIRTRIRNAIKRNSKKTNTFNLLGCDIKTIKRHLELKFKDGMSWKNYGDWEIDHVIPCNYFDLSKEENQRECFHYTNLQPLWKEDNLKKGAKIGT